MARAWDCVTPASFLLILLPLLLAADEAAGLESSAILTRSAPPNPIVLPLLLSSVNSSAGPDRLRRRHLQSPAASARMGLYDGLLSNGSYTVTRAIYCIYSTEYCISFGLDPRFQPDLSSTYRPVKCNADCTCDEEMLQCTYERQYAEMSSSSGVLGEDIVSFGAESAFPPQHAIFGCENSETGDIFSQHADGIMGLGHGQLSIVDQLVKKGVINDSFSLCYGGMDIGGGAMVLGGISPPPEMVFSHSDPDRSPYYNIELKELHVSGKPLHLNSRIFDRKHGTILDSGTTYAYLPEDAFKAFRDAIMSKVHLKQIPGPDPKYKDICFSGAGSDASQLSKIFPEVDMVFGNGQKLSLSPENYLFQLTSMNSLFPLIANEALKGIVVRNTLVSYDRQNQRVGFWKTNCSELWEKLDIQGAPSPAPSFSYTGPPIAELSPALSPSGMQNDVPPGLFMFPSDLSFPAGLKFGQFMGKANLYQPMFLCTSGSSHHDWYKGRFSTSWFYSGKENGQAGRAEDGSPSGKEGLHRRLKRDEERAYLNEEDGTLPLASEAALSKGIDYRADFEALCPEGRGPNLPETDKASDVQKAKHVYNARAWLRKLDFLDDGQFQIGLINFDISLSVKYPDLVPHMTELPDLIAHELEVDAQQVHLVNLTSTGNATLVRCAIFPLGSDSISNRTAMSIISRLIEHRVRLPENFGSYRLIEWNVEPPSRRFSVMVLPETQIRSSGNIQAGGRCSSRTRAPGILGKCSLSELSPLEAILFDIDGTLCDSDPIHYHAYREMLLEVGFNGGVPITEDFYAKNISGKHNEVIGSLLFPDWDHEKAMKFMDDKEVTFRRLASQQLKSVNGLHKLCKWIEDRGLKRAASMIMSIMLIFFPIFIPLDSCTFSFWKDSASGIKAGVAAGMPVVGLATRNPEQLLMDAGASFLIKDYEDPKLLAALEELERASATSGKVDA
ncbi:putative Haloacid dehalogenase-like hydrolase domain-containing protein Sgpp [Cocos nucifera]|uniref:Putative Haloacid dehalogenase-like hydrolase domain-containing protein Sgpp n=1 Tax=Cocos nucifera TaxID=13894 RepID=A0A8K0N7H8_COCNU|nr:putative Haloacid dehalogenase-like hydrolase domain-containing protein Sgpp [Cocos nucifera]